MPQNRSIVTSCLRLAAPCLFLIFCAGGCGKGAPGDARAAVGDAAAAAQEPIVIKFHDIGNAGVFAYAKREGILERALAPANAKVEWVPGPAAFSANVDAMNAGAINTAMAAVSPVVGALAHNLKFKIFTIADPAGIRQAGILAPKDSPIRTVKDLVGKRVAVNLAAHGDYILLRALEKNGVPAAQVERVPIQPPEAAAAFATGKIDAWSTFGVFFTSAVRNGAHVIAYEADLGSDDVLITSANVDVLHKNPAAFRALLKAVQDLTEEEHRSPEKFQNVFTDKGPTAVSGEDLRLAIEDARVAPVPRVPTPGDRVRIGNVVRLLFENKSIDRNISVDEIVYDIDAER
jgi:sulfonate transport system substrate-binding protein